MTYVSAYPRVKVADHVRNLIRTGQLRPGERIDTLGLSRDLGVNRATVQRGLAILEAEGLVVRLRAFGSFVAE